MNEKLIHYLQQQSCATICCVDEQGKPWCFSCFYIFNEAEGVLYFKSHDDALHSSILQKNPLVAGSVLPDKLNKLQIKGIQFTGKILNELHPLDAKAFGYYHKKNPQALAIAGKVWTLQLEHIKMTDNTLGFGKKISWHRNTPIVAD